MEAFNRLIEKHQQSVILCTKYVVSLELYQSRLSTLWHFIYLRQLLSASNVFICCKMLWKLLFCIWSSIVLFCSNQTNKSLFLNCLENNIFPIELRWFSFLFVYLKGVIEPYNENMFMSMKLQPFHYV